LLSAVQKDPTALNSPDLHILTSLSTNKPSTLLTNYVTPYSRVSLRKLTVPQLVKNFPGSL